MNPIARFKNYITGNAIAKTNDVFEKVRIDLTFNITCFFFLLGSMYYVSLIVNHYVWLTYVTTIAVISLPLVLVVLRRTGNVRYAAYLFIGEQLVVGLFNECFVNFNVDAEASFWTMTVILFAFFVLGKKWGWIMAIYAMVTIALGIANKQSGYAIFHFDIPKEQIPTNQPYLIFLPMLICVYSVHRMVLARSIAERQINLQKVALQKHNREIEIKNDDIVSSINYAKKIQYAVLPNEETIYRSIPLSFIIYKPRDIVSGDFFWFHQSSEFGVGSSENEIEKLSELNTPNSELFIVAADCTGHGVPGAFMTVIGSNALTQTVIENKITRPSEILVQLDNNVTHTLKQEKTHYGLVQDGMDLALLKINKAKKELTITSAKRPVFFIRNGELRDMKGSKSSIGGLRSESKQFDEIVINYQEDDMIYLFTDGVVDQFGGDNNKKFTSRRLRELLLGVHQLPVPEQKARIMEAFEKWKGNNEQTDDVLMIGIRF
jgi:serine phosphatase RsbU (regulator of sigma subunit)